MNFFKERKVNREVDNIKDKQKEKQNKINQRERMFYPTVKST